jgi:hypothetical protein
VCPRRGCAGRGVEHASKRPVAEAHQPERDLAQRLPRLLECEIKRVGDPRRGVAQLLNHLPDAHLSGVVFVGGGERLNDTDGLRLVELAREHRLRDRVQEASRISAVPTRVSGFNLVAPPGSRRSTTPSRACTSWVYSPLGSMISQRRPNTRLRYSQVLVSELLPKSGIPSTSVFAIDSTPCW